MSGFVEAVGSDVVGSGEAAAPDFLDEAADVLVLFAAGALVAALDAFRDLAAAAFTCGDVVFGRAFVALGVDTPSLATRPGRDVFFAGRAGVCLARPGVVPVRPGAVGPRLDLVGDVARADPFASALPLAVVGADRCRPPAPTGRGFALAGETAVTGVFFVGLR